MNFGLLDGSIITVYLIVTFLVGIAVRRSVGNVEHFLVAGREVDLYLGIASLAATEFGVITCMFTAELGYRFGFAGMVPGVLAALAYFFVGTTGFCINRLRDAGVVTVPELLEKRFGRNIRTATAFVTALGGLLNMGLFLRMAGEFFVGIGGLRPGYLEITMTAILLMVAAYTILGGMVSVLVTDFLQFVVMGIGLLCVTVLILVKVGWPAMVLAVESNHGAGGFNPFSNSSLGGEFLAYNGLLMLAGAVTWQPSIARVLAAKNARTGRRIYTATAPFFVCRFLLPGVWGVAALATLGSDRLSGESVKAMPIFLGSFVPTGLLGILVASMLAAEMGNLSSYMLSWGSVIYNDLISAFRKKPFSPRAGLLCNRSIVGLIGIFLLVYGLWYPLKGPLWNYITITATVYMSSSFVMLIACCYWRRASTAGAALAILLGAVGPLASLVIHHFNVQGIWAKLGQTEIAGLSGFLLAAVGMLVGSWVSPGREVRG